MDFFGGRNTEHFFNPIKEIEKKIQRAKTTSELDKIEREIKKKSYIPSDYKNRFQTAIDKRRKQLQGSKSKSMSSFVPQSVKEDTKQLKVEANREELPPPSSGGFCNIL